VLFLAIAITGEVIATSALKASDGMTRLVPSLVAIMGYGVAFFCLSRALLTIPLGVSYAIWSGVGIVALTLIGVFAYRQPLGFGELAGTCLILTGVMVIYWSR
jgi:small multidrug resistance pump